MVRRGVWRGTQVAVKQLYTHAAGLLEETDMELLEQEAVTMSTLQCHRPPPSTPLALTGVCWSVIRILRCFWVPACEGPAALLSDFETLRSVHLKQSTEKKVFVGGSHLLRSPAP